MFTRTKNRSPTPPPASRAALREFAACLHRQYLRSSTVNLQSEVSRVVLAILPFLPPTFRIGHPGSASRSQHAQHESSVCRPQATPESPPIRPPALNADFQGALHAYLLLPANASFSPLPYALPSCVRHPKRSPP